MIIILSLIVMSIAIGLILRAVVKTSRNSGYTSLGTLESQATAKASIPGNKKSLATPETTSKARVSTSREVRISPQRDAQVSPQNEEVAYIAELRQKLLLKAMGNVAIVERLTDYDRRRNPTGTLTICLQAAVDHWEDDHEARRRR